MENTYPHLIPNISDWPIAKQSAERPQFIERLNAFVMTQLLANHGEKLYDLISKTIYLENQRIKLTPWKVDPADEKSYWIKVNVDLEASLLREDKKDAQIDILKRIVNRYNSEIVGHFKVKTFEFSRVFLLALFKRIFSKYFAKGTWRWGGKKQMQEKIRLKGEIERVRSLFDKGTVVVLPTHYSNLDSVMIGYAMDINAGLPFFSYGAGLNLFNVEIVGYFINRLGAFRVDRRKKNPIYLECLKSMTGFSILEGVNCLFFPGGTRSRSGAVEDKLKLGLLGATIEAQRIHLENGDQKKIFVVPLNLGYHFVLEASQLIDQQLAAVGADKYKRQRKQGWSFKTIMGFIKDIYSSESEVYMSYGAPLDVFGNVVDDQGNSYDKFGRKVDINDYFTFDGKLSGNAQREGIYAKLLSETIVESYGRYNVVLSSSVVAFTAFCMIYEEYKQDGLMSLVNQKHKKYVIDSAHFAENIRLVVAFVKEKSQLGECILSDENWDNPTEILNIGMEKLGTFHIDKVLEKKSDGTILCDNIKLLYFYHNKLSHQNIVSVMGWQKI